MDDDMPPTNPKNPAQKGYEMPKAPAVVLWTNAPGGTPSYAVVTSYGKHALAVMVFPPESRIGVPKDGVRHVDDPWNKVNGINVDSGVWDYTDESKLLAKLAEMSFTATGLAEFASKGGK